jgi:UDP-glucuronate decarboxylase
MHYEKGEDLAVIQTNLGELSFEDQTVLVTGGAGFLGSWICEVLIAQNAKVICLDNLASGQEQNIRHLKGHENFSFLLHDISQPVNLDKKIDVILHMASRASPLEFEQFPIQIMKANTLGTWVALGIAKKNKARVLFTSTSEIYGESQIIPTPETYHGNVNTVGIRGCYDEAKRAGEALCMAYMRQHGVDVRIARIFNTYGPRMRGDGYYGRVVPRFIMQALDNEPITIFGDGSQTRSFCYVTDQIEGLLRFIARDGLKGEVINIGNPKELSVMDLASLIKKITGSRSGLQYFPLPQDDPRRRCPIITKAHDLLNWSPKVDLETGLRKTIHSMKSKKGNPTQKLIRS